MTCGTDLLNHSLPVNPEPAQATSRAPVLMPALVEMAFDYLVPDGTPEGALVEATLANRKLVGAVWQTAPEGKQAALEAKEIPLSKLKAVTRVIDTVPPLPAAYRRWLDWVADFTLAPKGAVLSLCGLAHAAKQPKKPLAPQQFTITLPTLTEAQQDVANALSQPHSKPVLLDGVTGSGKTEVYFHAMAAALNSASLRGAEGDAAIQSIEHMAPPSGLPRSARNDTRILPQILVLLPEIALTHQWLARFEKTFGAKPVVWHSRMTPVQKARAWQAVARGEAQVVVGARSALFLPFANLQLILVDEEHDPSYKQEDGVLYHARDMAVVRAHFEQIPIILASATPSLESLENVREGKYTALHLPERFGAAGLPTVALVDMRTDLPERGDFLSPTVKKEMLATLARGEQVLLFLNRRGYAPLLLCRHCGHRFQCDDCSAWLTVHGTSRLECHHCGHKEPMPPACPSCKADKSMLAPCGPGVERIAEEVRGMFHPSPYRGEDGRGPKYGKTSPLKHTLHQAKNLRHEMTQAETTLWQLLRRDSLGVKFRKQHPIGHYIADFACLSPKLIIELDGGQHTQDTAIAYDAKRSAFLESQGFTVLRFWNNDVLENSASVIETIASAVRRLSSLPCRGRVGEGPLESQPVPDKGPLLTSPLQGEEYRTPSLAVLSSDEAIAADTWAAIESGDIDILVGTQMVAKGHHFPRLTLVIVVDADVGLSGADLRAGERTYQMLHQLGGRAGRGELPGTVLIQTYESEHPVMQSLIAHDRDRLMALEGKERRAGGWPPFGQLAAILLDGVDDAKVRAAGQMLARSAPDDARLTVLGPAPAPLSKLRGQFRYRLLVKAKPGIHLQRTLRVWLAGQKFSGVRIKVDVNPYYFL